MITALGVKRAVRLLTDAGFHAPKRLDLDAMTRQWRDAMKLRAPWMDDDELVGAATEYTARDNPAVAWPTPGQLIECAVAVRSRTVTRYYQPEPDDGQRATPEEAREAWKRGTNGSGYDFNAVAAELGKRPRTEDR